MDLFFHHTRQHISPLICQCNNRDYSLLRLFKTIMGARQIPQYALNKLTNELPQTDLGHNRFERLSVYPLKEVTGSALLIKSCLRTQSTATIFFLRCCISQRFAMMCSFQQHFCSSPASELRCAPSLSNAWRPRATATASTVASRACPTTPTSGIIIYSCSLSNA